MTEAEVGIVIVGGKGTAVNVAEQIEDARIRFEQPVRCLGFAIDDPALGSSIAGLPVFCGVRELWQRFSHTTVQFLYCLYRPDVLAERYRLLLSLGIPEGRFARFVHPQAYVASSAAIAPGTVVLGGASIQSRASIGRHCVVNAGVVVEHEATVGDGCFLAAKSCVGARTSLGSSVFLGLAATIREDVKVGEGAFIGMSSAVLHDVETGRIAYGAPARVRP